ncbi:MAG: glycosyltransferase family 2 protein [Pseudonocardiaceae bacterium]
MRTISVITPVFAPTANYLRETITSVDAQRLPPGWRLEWLVQEDGQSPSLAPLFRDMGYVRYESNGGQAGIAATRNAALSRATGQLVQVLDHDDILLPGALETLIPRFSQHAIHWAIGQADDLMPNGDRVAWKSVLPFGRIERGAVNAVAIDHEANWSIHCAGLMLRTDSVRALGGWAAAPSDEDLVLFAALSEVSDGYNDPAVTWLYRQHPGQLTRSRDARDRSARGRRIALQRVMAARHSGLRLNQTTLETLEEAAAQSRDDELRVGPPEKKSP